MMDTHSFPLPAGANRNTCDAELMELAVARGEGKFSAGGALQIVAGCLSLIEQYVPPTVNLDIPDPACDLDFVPGRGRTVRMRCLLVTTRAIGPTYSAVILGPEP